MNLIGSIFIGIMLLCLAVLMILLIVSLAKIVFEDNTGNKNYKTKWGTELNPTNGKFYIYRQVGSNTEYVRNHFWLKRGYKDQVKAELIVDLLNK